MANRNHHGFGAAFLLHLSSDQAHAVLQMGKPVFDDIQQQLRQKQLEDPNQCLCATCVIDTWKRANAAVAALNVEKRLA